MQKSNFLISIVLLLAFIIGNSCKHEIKTRIVEGKKPVYKSFIEAEKIEFCDAKSIVNPGKIYIYGNKIFVIEQLEGVHIINNTNPSSPQLIKFIKIYGVKDIAIKNNILYADNITDFVAINISDVNNIRLEKRIKNVYSNKEQLFPEENCWFECVDTTKGIVVGWIDAQLENPMCSRGFERW